MQNTLRTSIAAALLALAAPLAAEPICTTVALATGWRHDLIQNPGQSLFGDSLTSFNFNNSPQFIQTNLRAKMVYDWIFARADFGFGGVVGGCDSYSDAHSIFSEGDAFSDNIHSGFGFDATVSAGLHLPIGYLSIDPEIGYLYKRVHVHQSNTVDVSMGLAGATLNADFNEQWTWSFFYYSLFKGNYQQQVKLDEIPQLPKFSGSARGFQLGTSVSYTFCDYWTVGAEWEMFRVRTGTATKVVDLISYSQRLRWTSNQVQLSVSYLF